ncbi:hypothetical protein CF319_g6883 [Tilletia indica]|nr:hypothetical protein CF319_g6883 [Tilletia indica]
MAGITPATIEHSAIRSDVDVALRGRLPQTELYILVTDLPPADKDFSRLDKEHSKLAAQLRMDLQPGTGAQRFSPILGNAMAKPQLCPSTAHLITLQTVLELTLIFFGVRLTLNESKSPCQHRDKDGEYDVCALHPDPAQVTKIQFRFQRRPGDLSSLADIDDAQMRGSLWDICDPVANSACWVYVQLAEYPQSREETARFMLSQLQYALSRPGGNERGTKRKYGVDDRTTLERTFRDNLLNIGPVKCALLGERTYVEAAHILPARLPSKIVRDAIRGIFDNHRESHVAPRCKPLFQRNGYYVDPDMDSLYDSTWNGILLGPQIHQIFDNRQNLWILRDTMTIVGVPTTVVELWMFNCNCPTLPARSEDETMSTEMLNRRIEHERSVKPFVCGIDKQKWAALHLVSALNFYNICMSGRGAVDRLLNQMTNSGGSSNPSCGPITPQALDTTGTTAFSASTISTASPASDPAPPPPAGHIVGHQLGLSRQESTVQAESTEEANSSSSSADSSLAQEEGEGHGYRNQSAFSASTSPVEFEPPPVYPKRSGKSLTATRQGDDDDAKTFATATGLIEAVSHLSAPTPMASPQVEDRGSEDYAEKFVRQLCDDLSELKDRDIEHVASFYSIVTRVEAICLLATQFARRSSAAST